MATPVEERNTFNPERTDGRGGVGGGGMLGYGNLALWARERAAAAQEMLS